MESDLVDPKEHWLLKVLDLVDLMEHSTMMESDLFHQKFR